MVRYIVILLFVQGINLPVNAQSDMTKTLYPCLWMNNNAKEAVDFYTQIFENSTILTENQMVILFELEGVKFMALNGGDHFTPNPSISFFVWFDRAEDVDRVANQLSEGGLVLMPLDKYDWSERYSWVQDKYGISWQIFYGSSPNGQKIAPTFMFCNIQQGRAKEAIEYYTNLFPGSKNLNIHYYPDNIPDIGGQVMYADFELNGNLHIAMDSGGPQPFTFNEGISIVIECEDQQEIDRYWDAFADGGNEGMCGWIQDKFGVSWQVIPAELKELMNTPERAARVSAAFLKMKKLDIATLRKAADE